MSEEKNIAKHKGGRPKQAVKRSQQLAVMCTMLERKSLNIKPGHQAFVYQNTCAHLH